MSTIKTGLHKAAPLRAVSFEAARKSIEAKIADTRKSTETKLRDVRRDIEGMKTDIEARSAVDYARMSESIALLSVQLSQIDERLQHLETAVASLKEKPSDDS